MDDWEKFSEVSSSEKEDFYSLLRMKDIINADYVHTKRVRKDFQIRKLGKHHLYIQSNTLLLADVFGNVSNMSLEIYDLDPAHFLSTPRLPW